MSLGSNPRYSISTLAHEGRPAEDPSVHSIGVPESQSSTAARCPRGKRRIGDFVSSLAAAICRCSIRLDSIANMCLNPSGRTPPRRCTLQERLTIGPRARRWQRLATHSKRASSCPTRPRRYTTRLVLQSLCHFVILSQPSAALRLFFAPRAFPFELPGPAPRSPCAIATSCQ